MLGLVFVKVAFGQFFFKATPCLVLGLVVGCLSRSWEASMTWTLRILFVVGVKLSGWWDRFTQSNLAAPHRKFDCGFYLWSR